MCSSVSQWNSRPLKVIGKQSGIGNSAISDSIETSSPDIILQHFFDNMMMGFSSDNTGLYYSRLLKTNKCFQRKKIIKRTQHFNICIKIDASIFSQSM